MPGYCSQLTRRSISVTIPPGCSEYVVTPVPGKSITCNYQWWIQDLCARLFFNRYDVTHVHTQMTNHTPHKDTSSHHPHPTRVHAPPLPLYLHPSTCACPTTHTPNHMSTFESSCQFTGEEYVSEFTLSVDCNLAIASLLLEHEVVPIHAGPCVSPRRDCDHPTGCRGLQQVNQQVRQQEVT